MEKYSRLSKITNEYLHGTLCKLQVNYENENSMNINFVYEDDNHYWFDYQIQLDTQNMAVEYASHHSEGHLNKVELNRESDFEQAVERALFQSKLQLA